MKRIACIILLLSSLLSACSIQKQTPTIPDDNFTHGVYKLTFKTKKISNDHVGNEWSFSYTYNGLPIQNGYTITQSLEVFSFHPIDIVVREHDKNDDVGTGTLRVAMCDGGLGEVQITVTETDGRYKGNMAVWKITCLVELVSKEYIESY